MSGIYEIRNLLNNHRYIGSSININKRWAEHINDLKADRHANRYLQNAWNKYGQEYFEFNLLEECESNKDLLIIEQRYLDSNPEYNICKIAGNSLGVVFSDERKVKIGLANSKRKIKDSTRKKYSNNSKNSLWNARQRKPVVMIDLFGRLVCEFNSIIEAAKYLGDTNKRVNIKKVTQGVRKTAYGYNWILKRDYNDL